jgi:hypothetical protein
VAFMLLLSVDPVPADHHPHRGQYGTSQDDQFTNFVSDGKTGIDFSQGVVGADGVVCVERRKTVDKTEKDQLKECFVQNVTQCYNTYITEYSDVEVQGSKEDRYLALVSNNVQIHLNPLPPAT